jgi:hypothetical protein
MGHRRNKKVKPKVLLYCPTYKVRGREQIKPETRASIEVIEFDGVVDKVINSDSEYPPPSHENTLAHYQQARQRVLDEGYDALLTVEHDIIIPRDGLQKLWDIDKPVAYGVYIFRGSGNVVNAFRMVKAKNLDMPMSTFKGMLARALEQEVIEVSGTGNGCTLIRREVLEQIDFRRASEDNPVPDMPFSTDCMKAGIEQWAHFGVLCGHVLETGILWVNTDGGIGMTKVEVLQDFVGADAIKYRKGKTYPMEDKYVEDYERAGFITTGKGKEWVTKKTNTKKTIAFRKHQNKALVLAKALKRGGYNIVDSPIMADVLLIDHDIKEFGHQEHVKRFHDAGKPVFIYPHGAAPLLCWDGIHEPSDMIKANFVTSKGHQQVMKRYGYPIPTHVIGWYLCEQKPWEPTNGYKVLFGPIHPMMGYVFMFPEDLEANKRTYERLLEIKMIDLTVRHIGNLQNNGLWEDERATIYQGKTDQNLDLIKQADLVIANGTMAYMAIALGIPTIMLNQLTPAREPDIHTLERMESVSIEKYEKYMRYPFDVENDSTLQKVIDDACQKEPKQWRKRFIGEQFDPVYFVKLLEGLIDEED